MYPLLIIRAGNTHVQARAMFGDFDSFIIHGLSKKPDNYLVLNAQVQPKYPEVKKLRGVIITGSHENVTDKTAWMMHLQNFILKVHSAGTPLLGICFGHQIIGEALGGKVDFYGDGEFGIIGVETHGEELIFENNFQSKFFAYASHSQSIITLPKGAISLASSNNEPNHIVWFGNKTWGLQFHPEFNSKIMKIYLNKNKLNSDLYNANEKANAEEMGCFILDSFLDYCH